MNRTNLLVTSAIVAFVAATGASMAQQAPQQEHKAPAEKVAPQNAPGVHDQAPSGRVGETPQNCDRWEITGQAPQGDRQSRPGEHSSQQERGRAEQPPRCERNEQNRTTGQAPREDRLDRGPERTARPAKRLGKSTIGLDRNEGKLTGPRGIERPPARVRLA